ncbi:peptidoglycan-binding protein [Paractinoplanes brasiliensis]|uniref:Multidrug efflux pump subunit AcrA (Membrane-fusion protein) n=1 Tax=Paractinoplanes brasiliensis TaxID=52695 RepID=A0A4V3C7B2_9ACTN|nr:peptidoglycan-binding protein [Actinoplanes brasiliensis]TDO36938.1 multidrug efflux pump subunit AcrA (membrane-fusion protein) [Actinoplanes brasiliensis]GID30460.1 peptidoglycan-binding protein [Actinoplanes brasiliensis]
MGRRTIVGVSVAVAVLAGAGTTAVVLRPPPGPPESSAVDGPTTTVERETLLGSVTVDGELGYGEPVPIAAKAPGTVTWLPKVGARIRRGGALLRADDMPVVLLYGALPIYRELRPGAEGPDVALLERNLRALGYTGFTVDDEYTGVTAEAVRRWQKDLGREETGVVDPTWLVVADGAIRVAGLKVRPGAAATGEVLTCTGAASVVTVDVEADGAGWAQPGVKVTVTLPNDKKTPGTVASVGAKAEPKEPGGTATIPVTVALGDEAPLGKLREGPVTVTYVSERRENVLAVPVAALVALPEGGYGLETVDGGTRRFLPVEVGLIADGKVEVRGAGLAVGMTVGLPK